MKLITFAFLIISLFIFGCSSSEMFTYVPDNEKTETEKETATAFIEDDILFSSFEFEEESGNNFMFYLFVINKSDEKIEVSPSKIKMIAFDENKKPIEGMNTFYAIEPRLMIGKLNNEIKDRETEHEISTGLNFVYALVNTAVDLSNNNKNDASSVLENVAAFAETQINEEVNFSNDVEYLKAQKKIWEFDVMPNIYLEPLDDIGGLVFIPSCTEAEYLKIIIPFEKTKHIYFFKKEKIDAHE